MSARQRYFLCQIVSYAMSLATNTTMSLLLLQVMLVFSSRHATDAFSGATTKVVRRATLSHHRYGMIPDNFAWAAIDVDTVASTVQVFDGSSIVDPVVVSNAFWNSLQTKVVSFVLAQVLAAAVFSLLLTLLASQLNRITSWGISEIFGQFSPPPSVSKLRIPPGLQSQSHDPRTAVTNQPDFLKLLACIAIDTIGTSSEMIPILGELTDIVWAPLAGLLLRQLFYGSNVVLLLEATEEILPLTDILPFCTICWVVDTYFGGSRVAQVLQVGQYGQNNNAASSGSVKEIDPTNTNKDKAQ